MQMRKWEKHGEEMRMWMRISRNTGSNVMNGYVICSVNSESGGEVRMWDVICRIGGDGGDDYQE